MQHHFVIYFDTDDKHWHIDDSPLLENGNVYDPDNYPGWFVPEEGSYHERMDHEAFLTLSYVIDTLPAPNEVSNDN